MLNLIGTVINASLIPLSAIITYLIFFAYVLDNIFKFLYNKTWLPKIMTKNEIGGIFMVNISLVSSAKTFEPQVKDLTTLVDICLSETGLPVSCEPGTNGLCVEKTLDSVKITYEKTCEFFRGLLILIEREGEEAFTVSDHAHFKFNGEFLDNSRNAVLTVPTVKNMIMYSALLGLDNIFLYNEDTFDVPEDPYFGYFRMPYTKEDVRILNDYAKGFGVRIIPCIQTLAHLGQTLHWPAHRDIRDYADVLLVEEDKTYELIENTLKAWRECVDSDLINIGMDEAYFLGRGQYLDKHGFHSRFELMCDHLKKVTALCKKYHFRPMMWSDMFFSLVFGSGQFDNSAYYSDKQIDPQLMKLIPEEVILVYWDYYTTSKEQYIQVMKKHQQFPNELMFAGGTWKWRGMVPAIDHSHRVTKMALEAAKECNLDNVFTTAWGDNGAEASIYTILPGLCLHAEESYAADHIDERVSSKLKVLTGYTLEEYFALCKPDRTYTNNAVPETNPTKYLFFQDILMGIFDYHVTPDFPAFYADCAAMLHDLAKRESHVNYIFESIACLCDVVSIKCNVGNELKAAYEANDIPAMKAIATDILPEILNRIEIFYRAFKTQWYRENRTGGFDTQDLRIGGLKQRILTAQETILMYVDGKIGHIRELEEKRLPYDGIFGDDRKDINTQCNLWHQIVTTNIL